MKLSDLKINQVFYVFQNGIKEYKILTIGMSENGNIFAESLTEKFFESKEDNKVLMRSHSYRTDREDYLFSTNRKDLELHDNEANIERALDNINSCEESIKKSQKEILQAQVNIIELKKNGY